MEPKQNLAFSSFEKHNDLFCIAHQPAFTCSKLTVVALEQDVKYVQS